MRFLNPLAEMAPNDPPLEFSSQELEAVAALANTLQVAEYELRHVGGERWEVRRLPFRGLKTWFDFQGRPMAWPATPSWAARMVALPNWGVLNFSLSVKSQVIYHLSTRRGGLDPAEYSTRTHPDRLEIARVKIRDTWQVFSGPGELREFLPLANDGQVLTCPLRRLGATTFDVFSVLGIRQSKNKNVHYRLCGSRLVVCLGLPPPEEEPYLTQA